MIQLECTEVSDAEIYDACLDGVTDEGLKQCYQMIYPELSEAYDEYRNHASLGALSDLPVLPNRTSDDEIVIGAINKGQLKALYSAYLVPSAKPGRLFYDRLIVAGDRKCPSCGMGQVGALDHYLPKSRYPKYSVLPANLIPSCRDCNTGKGASIAETAQEQVLHPFLDADHFYQEQWLFAQVVWSNPLSIKYYVDAPAHWSETDRNRVKKHFDDYKLALRFSTEAGERLVELLSQRAILLRSGGPEACREFLRESVEHYRNHVNDRRRAMYQALENAEGFWDPDV